MLTMIKVLLILTKSAAFDFLSILNTFNNTNLQISQVNFTLYIKIQLNFGHETEHSLVTINIHYTSPSLMIPF